MTMSTTRALTALLVGVMLISAACGTARPDNVPALPPSNVVLLDADDDGAVLLDGETGALRGFDRTGREVWSDRQAYAENAGGRCLAHCPDAVLFADPTTAAFSPRQIVAGTRSDFPVALSPERGLVTVRSTTDFVTLEQDASGAAALHLSRADGTTFPVPVPTTDMAWAENPEGTVALALPRNPDTTAGTVLRFRRDDQGWLPAGELLPNTGVWDACVAGDGELSLLPGPDPIMLVAQRERIPVDTDLVVAAECVLGRAGGAMVRRVLSADGSSRTEVRGVEARGDQVWSRGYRFDAYLSAHPDGSLIAVTGGGKLELVDARGTTRSTTDGVVAAQFTPAGRLVTVDSGRTVRWLDV